MRFEHIDVWNGEYNTAGRIAELDTVFPVASGTIDLAFATSVFTHMRMGGLHRYLAETARVLKPAGRLAFTAFALESHRQSSDTFDFQPFRRHFNGKIDQRYPERAIGHWRPALEAAVSEAGMRIVGAFNGAWAPPATYEGGQDLFVVAKR